MLRISDTRFERARSTFFQYSRYFPYLPYSAIVLDSIHTSYSRWLNWLAMAEAPAQVEPVAAEAEAAPQAEDALQIDVHVGSEPNLAASMLTS